MFKEEEKLSREILSRLLRNPNAGDTLEGIATWWLDIDRRHLPLKTAAAALDILLKTGQIKARPLPGGPTLYKINRQ
jgi:hypothetical protein